MLYISSDQPTLVGIVYHFNDLSSYDTTFVLTPGGGTALEVNVTRLSGRETELTFGDETVMKGIELFAASDFSVIAASLNGRSCDAFLCYPEQSWTNHSIVMAYPQGQPTPSSPVFADPSQFAVVAGAHGATLQVTLRPDVTLRLKWSGTFTIDLQPGEVFFAQKDDHNGPLDLTGTEIVANNPIAVFGGCARTSVPDTGTDFRDFVAEQIPPPEYWRRDAVLIPFYPIAPESPLKEDEARIVSLVDSTQWTLDGIEQPPLMKGVPRIVSFSEPRVIVADKPILVAQFGHSGGVFWDQARKFPKLGDPSMVIVPAREQFDSAYTFESIPDTLFDDTAHFITVVIPTSGTSAFSLDGTKVLRTFTPIAGTDLSYVRIRVAPGSHTAWAAVPFGLTVYGFGPATSYAYVPGMRLRPTPSSVPYDPERQGGVRLWLSGANPVRGRAATIGVELDRPASVHLALYDVAGTELRTVLDRSALPAGVLTVDVDLHDLSPGMYYARLRTGTGVSLTEKLVIDR
jgi:hypothetical protein